MVHAPDIVNPHAPITPTKSVRRIQKRKQRQRQQKPSPDPDESPFRKDEGDGRVHIDTFV